MEDVPVEVESTAADAVRDAQSFETRQTVGYDGQAQVIARQRRITELDQRLVLDLLVHLCTPQQRTRRQQTPPRGPAPSPNAESS